jgi:hypothetical protein
MGVSRTLAHLLAGQSNKLSQTRDLYTKVTHDKD